MHQRLSAASPPVSPSPRQGTARATRATANMPYSMYALRFAGQQKIAPQTKRHVAHRASPRHCHARARRAAPCTRPRACRARSSRTLHAYACEPRQRRTCSHIATRACTSKARMVCSCHWPLADCRSAHCMRIWLAHELQMLSACASRGHTCTLFWADLS